MKARIYQVPPAVFAPIALGAASFVLAPIWSWWSLLAIPFVYIGSICAVPNLNLANGCLAYLSMIIGFGVFALHHQSGAAIAAGAMAGFYLSAAEKWLRMKPVSEDPRA